MTVISQDDHLTAGAWAACVLTSLSPIAAVTCFPHATNFLKERVATKKVYARDYHRILIEQAISFISQRNIVPQYSFLFSLPQDRFGWAIAICNCNLVCQQSMATVVRFNARSKISSFIPHYQTLDYESLTNGPYVWTFWKSFETVRFVWIDFASQRTVSRGIWPWIKPTWA